jgi:drug/metabolite transporter (DMT)-like permease
MLARRPLDIAAASPKLAFSSWRNALTAWKRAGRALNGSAVTLLVLTAAMWGANGVISRAAVGQIPPLTLVMLRWLVVCAVLAPFMGRELRKAAPVLASRARYLSLMALAGYTGFNVLFYLAGSRTSAVNIVLLQGAIPATVLAMGALFKGMPARPAQVAGIALSFGGAGLIATRGDLLALGGMSFNSGDAMMLAACVLYALYTVALRDRPPLPPLVFFSGMAIAAFLESAPFFAYEVVSGGFFWPTARGWAFVLFVALFPSLISQIFFMRAVELIGPGRAGVFTNLTPLFGALFAISLLGEPFHAYHAGAMSLGLSGIALAEWGGRKRGQA